MLNFFYIFRSVLKDLIILGTTGFDSKVSLNRSMSSNETALVNLGFNNINGEDNYALAA